MKNLEIFFFRRTTPLRSYSFHFSFLDVVVVVVVVVVFVVVVVDIVVVVVVVVVVVMYFVVMYFIILSFHFSFLDIIIPIEEEKTSVEHAYITSCIFIGGYCS